MNIHNHGKSQFFNTREETSEWLDEHKVKNYTINEDLSVDVNGTVDLVNQNLKLIPVKFNNVTGHFDCGRNKLTSLAGSPKTVDGSFVCCLNFYLLNLKYSPEFVGGNFDCDYCNLLSLEGASQTVGLKFMCRNNKLKNLNWLPQTVIGAIYCQGNPLRTIDDLSKCNFNGRFIFTVDKLNFSNKDLLKILLSCRPIDSIISGTYIVENEEYNCKIKPYLESGLLQQGLVKSENKRKTKNNFI